jgi:hypothetical protein
MEFFVKFIVTPCVPGGAFGFVFLPRPIPSPEAKRRERGWEKEAEIIERKFYVMRRG